MTTKPAIVANPLREILNSAVYLAVATGFLTVMGVLYQMGYYSYFGINPVIAGIPLDSLTMTNGSVVPIFSAAIALLGLGAFILYRKAQGYDMILTSYIIKVLVLLMGIASVVLVLLTREVEFLTAATVIAAIVSTAVTFIIESISTFRYYRQHNYRIKLADIMKADGKNEDDKIGSKPFVIAIAATMLMSILSVHNVAQSFAQNQKSFTIIAQNGYSNNIEVVVARSSDGLIVKQFDPGLDAWEQGYYILKESDQTFIMKNISDLR